MATSCKWRSFAGGLFGEASCSLPHSPPSLLPHPQPLQTESPADLNSNMHADDCVFLDDVAGIACVLAHRLSRPCWTLFCTSPNERRWQNTSYTLLEGQPSSSPFHQKEFRRFLMPRMKDRRRSEQESFSLASPNSPSAPPHHLHPIPRTSSTEPIDPQPAHVRPVV